MPAASAEPSAAVSETPRRLAFRIEERPRTAWESLLYGWQHTLVDISPFVLPLAVAAALGLAPGEQAQLINAGLVAMGLATLVQTILGNRLPIIQGPSATVTGTLVSVAQQSGGPAMWGAAFVGAILELLLGATRLVGALRRLLPPAVSSVVILAIAASLGQFAARLTFGDGAGRNFLFAGAAIVSILLFQTLGARLWGEILARGAIFLTIWLIGLGLGSALGAVDWSLVAAKPWLGLPSLFPWGGPGFGWELVPAAVIGVAIGYLGSVVESLGDYAATCAVADEPYQVKHMNRGIFAEGLGCLVALSVGGLPVTSYTQNIGVIATTRVASRFVVQVAAGILILYGLCPKFGALLVALPRPVLGGVFLLVCGLIAAAGLSLLANVESTPANSLVIGIPLVAALAIPATVRAQLPQWLEAQHPLVELLLTNSVVLAVVLGVVLNLVLNVWLGEAE
ncbi:MAG TPA: solute carrier family 23 protein [Thermoanaerobaculia bacterium]|nr:solute carrier family 23 protein [Thermoanaerobaculia bacterium]